MRYFCLIAWIALCAFSVGQAEVRKWTARTGSFSTEAELVDVSGGNVVLKKRDGSVVTVPLDRLSLSDVRYVEKYLRDATAAIGRNDTPADEPESADDKAAAKRVGGGGPPLAKPNSSRWQVHPDPGEAVQVRDVSIPLMNESGIGGVLVPATPSRYVGYYSSSIKSSVQAWDIRSGARLGPITVEGHTHTKPALSPDGDLIAISQGGSSGKLQVWSLKKKSVVKELTTGSRSGLVQFLAFAGPRRLVVASGYDEGLRVLDPRSGTEISSISVRTINLAQSAAVSPGGNYIAISADSSGAIRLYDLRNGEMAGQVEEGADGGQHASYAALRFSPDGQELAALQESPKGTLCCWSMKNGKLVASHVLDRGVSARGIDGNPLDFIPGNKGWLVHGTSVVDRERGGPIWAAKQKLGRDNTFLRMLDGERMLIATSDYQNGKLTVERLPWSEINASAGVVAKGGLAKDLGLPALTKAKSATAKSMKLAATKGAWKVEPDALATKLQPQSFRVGSSLVLSEPVLIAPAGGRAVIASRETQRSGEIYAKAVYTRLQLKSGNEEGAIEPGFATKAMDVNVEGTRLVVATMPDQDRVDVYDFRGGKHVVGFRPYQDQEGFKTRVNWAALLDDDKLLTLNSDGVLILWSLPGCEAVYTLKLPLIRTPGLSPGRKYLVIHADDTYSIVDSHSGIQVGTLQSPTNEAGRYLTQCEFRADGKLLAGVLRDFRNTTKPGLVCWDMATGKIQNEMPLEAAEDVTWIGGQQVLIHRPLGDLREPIVGRFPPKRFDLVDLGTSRVLWRYQLPIGQFGSSPCGGLVWYVTLKDYGQPMSLVGAALPAKETSDIWNSASRPTNLLPAGATVTLDVTASITGDSLADKVLQDELRRKITDDLTRRGLKIEERSALGLRVALKESLTGRLTELRPILGGVAFRYQVHGRVLTCELSLNDVSRQKLWSQQTTIPIREEIPRTGIPKGTSPEAFVRQQQWQDALQWISREGLPQEIYEAWAYSGMGESVLTTSGETLLSMDVPPK